MNKNKFLLSMLLLIITLWSCDNSDYYEQTNDNESQSILIQNPKFAKSDTIECEPLEFSDRANKTVSGLYHFIDGGTVKIGKEKFYTVIIGDQRWFSEYITLRVAGSATVDDDIFADNVVYYKYSSAMSLNGVEVKNLKQVPNDLIELSEWRIPSLDDAKKLWDNVACTSRYEEYRKIGKGLEFVGTGAFFDPKLETIWDADFEYFWLSDTLNTDEYTKHYYVRFNNESFVIGASNLSVENIWFPVRLVQDIEPIEDVF